MEHVLIPIEIIELFDDYGSKKIRANYLKLDENKELEKEEIRVVIPSSIWDISEYTKGFKYIKGFWYDSKTSDGLRKLCAEYDMTDMDDHEKDSVIDDILGHIDYERDQRLKRLDSMVINYLSIKELLDEKKIRLS